MTNHQFETAWKGINPNQGHNAGGCHPVPLRDPYVLWDTRNFAPTTFGIKAGGIYPGPLSVPTRLLGSTSSSFEVYWGPLVNEGTGGSKFDLHVYYDQPTGAQQAGRITAIKYYLNGSFDENLGDDWPLSWDDYEGDPCEAPFTVIYGLGHIGRNEDWGFFHEHEWKDDPIYKDSGSLFFDEIDPISGDTIYGSFSGLYCDDFSQGLDYFPNEVDFFGDYAQLNNEILTITFDPRCQESYVWVGTNLVISPDASDFGEPIARYFYTGNCEDWANASDATTNGIYMEMYGYDDAPFLNDGSDYVQGPWPSVVGIAKFRGSPSLEDLQYWQEYFRAGAPFTIGFSETNTAVTDTREVYPNPFRYRYTGAIQTYTVPCGVDNIRITCYGAGRANDGLGGYGGMAEAEFAVTPGDVFDVYVGGNPSGLTGGWPNGGSPQNGNNNEGQPGFGSSHVIPTGLTFADALVVGGGGGGVNDLGGSRNTVIEGVTAGSGGYPVGSDGNGPDGPDDGIEWGGKGGDQASGGAVGVTTGGSGNATAGDSAGQGIGGRAAGSSNFFAFAGGSGGGGWHGGGGAGNPRLKGGGSYAGDGGGGSSYTAPSGTNANYVNASWFESGMVEILALVDPEDIGC